MANENKKWVLVHGDEEQPEKGIAYARQTIINGEEFTEVVEIVQLTRRVAREVVEFIKVRNFTVYVPDAIEFDETEGDYINNPETEPEKFGYEVALRTWEQEYISYESAPYPLDYLEGIKVILNDYLSKDYSYEG